MTPEEIRAAGAAAVAGWAPPSGERKAELRRILLGATKTAGPTSTGEKSARRTTTRKSA